MKQKLNSNEDAGGVIMDIAAAAEVAKLQIEEEEAALLELVKKTGTLTFVVPEKNHWKYAYQSDRREGIATARHARIYKSSGALLSIEYGPTPEFIKNTCSYQFIRKHMGGLFPILAAVRAAQAKAAREFDDGRAQALAVIKASTEV